MDCKRTDPDKCEEALEDAIQEVCSKLKADDPARPIWTREIKGELARLGKSQGFQVYAAGCGDVRVDGGEWLYDLIWMEYEKGPEGTEILRSVPLIVECEWEPNGADADFQKLVVGRADHRLMVMTKQNPESAQDAVEKLLPHVTNSKHSVLGDRYLFGVWTWPDKVFEYFAYEVQL